LKRRFFYLIIVFSVFSAVNLFAVAEVDLINPNEPIADLGIYNDADNSAESSFVTKENEKILPFIWQNVCGTVVPFKCGSGSFKQGDFWGGIGLVGFKLAQDCALGFTTYYAVKNCVLWYEKNYGDDFIDERIWLSERQENYSNMKMCAWITLGCFVANNAASIAFPIIKHHNVKKDKEEAASNFSKVSFYPVVTTEECGAVAVIRF